MKVGINTTGTKTILTESALCLVCSRLLPLAPPSPPHKERLGFAHAHSNSTGLLFGEEGSRDEATWYKDDQT